MAGSWTAKKRQRAGALRDASRVTAGQCISGVAITGCAASFLRASIRPAGRDRLCSGIEHGHLRGRAPHSRKRRPKAAIQLRRAVSCDREYENKSRLFHHVGMSVGIRFGRFRLPVRPGFQPAGGGFRRVGACKPNADRTRARRPSPKPDSGRNFPYQVNGGKAAGGGFRISGDGKLGRDSRLGEKPSDGGPGLGGQRAAGAIA
jgi:hypothetical protein